MRIALSFLGCHRRGGIERVVLECANFLQARGHETLLLASDWDPEALDPAVQVRPVPIPSRGALPRLLAYTCRSRRALTALQPPPDAHAAFGVISPPGGVMWVPSVHRAWLDASRRQRDWKGRLKQRLNPSHPFLLALERNYFGRRRYRRLVALTDQVKADLIRWYDVLPADIDVLPNGYAPGEFNWPRMEAHRAARRAALGYGDADRVVIFVANELERKGFGPLLRAVAALDDPSVHLLAVGRLSAQTYAAEIARLGMTERVQFTGPSADVALFYAAADLFALPTQYEAWGLVIVEALACGLPVVTSRLAGAAIAVHEGETGTLLDDPNSVDEITRSLCGALAGGLTRSETIAQSVLALGWPAVLERFEQILETYSLNAKDTTTPLRTLLLTDADVFAGTERHMLDLARGLRDAGALVTLSGPSPSPLARAAQAEDVPFLPIPKRGLVDWRAVLTVRAALRRGKFDIVHAHNGRTALVAALAVWLARRGRCVMTQHFLEPNHASQAGPKGWLTRTAHHWVMRQMHRVIAISQAARQGMLARGEADDARITVVPNGITPPTLEDDQLVRRELGIAPNAPLIVCAARLEREKDVATLIAAMPAVAAAISGARCLIAGEGALRPALEAQIAALDLENAVTLLGFRTDAAAVLSAGEVFVLPSLAEPFGLVLLEAMALGKPVIATQAGGPLEIVVPGETGHLVPPSQPDALAQALIDLLSDVDRRRAWGRAGRERFQSLYTVDRMAQTVLALYGASPGPETSPVSSRSEAMAAS